MNAIVVLYVLVILLFIFVIYELVFLNKQYEHYTDVVEKQKREIDHLWVIVKRDRKALRKYFPNFERVINLSSEDREPLNLCEGYTDVMTALYAPEHAKAQCDAFIKADKEYHNGTENVGK